MSVALFRVVWLMLRQRKYRLAWILMFRRSQIERVELVKVDDAHS